MKNLCTLTLGVLGDVGYAHVALAASTVIVADNGVRANQRLDINGEGQKTNLQEHTR
jgi:hypothetical protein